MSACAVLFICSEDERRYWVVKTTWSWINIGIFFIFGWTNITKALIISACVGFQTLCFVSLLYLLVTRLKKMYVNIRSSLSPPDVQGLVFLLLCSIQSAQSRSFKHYSSSLNPYDCCWKLFRHYIKKTLQNSPIFWIRLGINAYFVRDKTQKQMVLLFNDVKSIMYSKTCRGLGNLGKATLY